ncbi:MAG: DegV family protein [Defluviitoga tunisiensis]
MIGLICDSATDTPKEILEKDFVEMVPLKVIINGKEYKDSVEITQREVIEAMEHSIPQTSLPSREDIFKAYKSLIERGYKEIFVITVPEKLSGTFGLFYSVANEIKKMYSDVKIEVIDSNSGSLGAAMIVCKVAEYIEDKKSFDYIRDQLDILINGKSKVFFVVPTLKYLKAGGRIGKVSGTLGEILNVKPIISINEDGEFHEVGRARGMNKAIDKMIDSFLQWVGEKKLEFLAIAKSGIKEETEKHFNYVRSRLEHLNPKKIFTGEISSVALVHLGDGLVGVGGLLE